MKTTDTWQTPIWFMNVIGGNFIDRCPKNHTTAMNGNVYDCLKEEWDDGDSYVNPPYSNPLPFVLRAIEQHEKYNKVVCLLLKLDTTTRWYKALVEAGAHFMYFAERLHYSESKERPPFSSVLVVLSRGSDGI